ncbi:MAG: prepilin peptidase [Clostridia bacterium]|nr:prepilin peptidase [Clostridia bacterium]
MSIYEYRPVLIYCIVVAAALGAVAGSFLNCAAWRIVRGESFIRGRSRCPACGHTLGASELIPIVSWVVQRGRCKACGAKVSARYPLTELCFAALTVMCLLRFGLTPLCLRNFLFLCCLFLLTLTDLEDMTIPDGCHIAAIAIWVIFLPFTFKGWRDVLMSVLAAFIYGGGLLLVSLIMDKVLGRDSLGGGDIKLFFVIGLYLGIVGTLFALVLACVLGLAFNAILNRKDGGRAFPFGPSIAAAAALMLLYGEPLIKWYMGLLG